MLSMEIEYLSREIEYLKFSIFLTLLKKKAKGISKHCHYFQI